MLRSLVPCSLVKTGTNGFLFWFCLFSHLSLLRLSPCYVYVTQRNSRFPSQPERQVPWPVRTQIHGKSAGRSAGPSGGRAPHRLRAGWALLPSLPEASGLLVSVASTLSVCEVLPAPSFSLNDVFRNYCLGGEISFWRMKKSGTPKSVRCLGSEERAHSPCGKEKGTGE